MIEGEKSKKRETGNPEPAHGLQAKQCLNMLGLLSGLNRVLGIEYRGQVIPPGSMVILAIIVNEYRNEGFCNHDVILSQFGRNALNGKFVSILERSLLIKRIELGQWMPTAEGELLLRSVITDLNRIVLNKPSKRWRNPDAPTGTRHNQNHPFKKNVKGLHFKRPQVPIDSFNRLVEEVLSKPGLNKKAKYILLRALGMKVPQAKEAIKQLEKGKHTDRIKPILKDILSKLAE